MVKNIKDENLEFDEEEELTEKKVPAKAKVDNGESHDEIPQGYLSLAEMARDYPDFRLQVESAFGMKEGMPTKPTMKIMVYINEPFPIKARILSKDTIEILKNKEPISMLAYDALCLVGDPKYRFDLMEAPSELNIFLDNWGAMKRQTLEYTFRVSQHAGHGKKMARYTDGEYTVKLEEYGLLDKIPDIRFLVDANVVESVAPKVDLLDKVWELMKLQGIRPDKDGKFTTPQKKTIAASLEQMAHVYGMESMLKGKNSDMHVGYFMGEAWEKNAPLPV